MIADEVSSEPTGIHVDPAQRAQPLIFKASPAPTLGVEVELGLVDPFTRNLVPRSEEILAHFEGNPKLHAELFQSIVEVTTGVCKDVAEVERDLWASFQELKAYGDAHDIKFQCSGTHPFGDPRHQPISRKDRYHRLIRTMRWPAQRLLIFGVHVHVGVGSGEKAIAVMNSLPAYIPHLIALSASSPFWIGQDTGLASTRLKIFEALPTAGLPPYLQNWAEFAKLMRTLLNAGAISSIKEIWWDIRPHLDFGTLEIRICDGLGCLFEICTVVAFVQALVVHLGDMYDRGETLPVLRNWTIKENKWRASRYGAEARLIRNERGDQEDVVSHLRSVVYELQETAKRLGCVEYLNRIEDIFAMGPNCARQRYVYEQTRDFKAVVDMMIQEFETGKLVPIPGFELKPGGESQGMGEAAR